MGTIPSMLLPDGAAAAADVVEDALARRVGGVGNNCRLAPKSPWSRGATTPVGGVEGSGSGTVRDAFSCCCFFCFFLLLLVLLLETVSCFLFLFLEEEQALAAAAADDDDDDDGKDELAPCTSCCCCCCCC